MLCGVLAVVLLSACARTAIPTTPPVVITVSGSSAMAPLLTRLAARFQQQQTSIVVAVDPRDSALGLADVIAGRVALAAVSVAPPEDMWAAPIAVDGIAIVVHPDNPLPGLTLAQLHDVFSGRVWQWHELGVMVAGDEIQVISREEGSGTRRSFEALAMRADLSALIGCPPARLPDPAGDAAQLTATPATACALDPVTTMALVVMDSQSVIDTVSGHPGAIGYVSRAYAGSQVKVLSIEGVPPDPERTYGASPLGQAGASPLYALTQPFFLVAPQEPTGAARSFVDFCLSPQGQAIVAEHYAPVRR